MNRADRVPYQDRQPKLDTDDIVASIDDLDQCIRLILEPPNCRDSIVIRLRLGRLLAGIPLWWVWQ